MSRMRVAVTGAGGQIGSYLARRLAANRQFAVVPVCRNSLVAKMLAQAGCEPARIGSITERESAREMIKDCNAIVHCALAGGPPGEARASNLAMIRCLADVPNIKCFVFLSSVAVYSSCTETGVNTYRVPSPDTAYGKAKLLCEREVLSRSSGLGRRPIVLRLGHVYGVSQNWSRRFLEWSHVTDFQLPFAGSLPSNTIRIDRVGDAIVTVLEDSLPSGIYNVADDPHLNWAEVFRWHTQVIGRAPVAAMDDKTSELLRRQFIQAKHRSLGTLASEFGRAVRPVITEVTRSYPTLLQLGQAVLVKSWPALQRRVKTKYVRMLAGRDVDVVLASAPRYEPLLFSDPMPGKYLPLPPLAHIDPSRDEEQRGELWRWFRRWGHPQGPWL